MVKGEPGRSADAPQFAGTAGQGRASARGFSTLSLAGTRRAFTTTSRLHQEGKGELLLH